MLLRTKYPKNGAIVPLIPVIKTCADIYSDSRPFGAILVTHKLHAIEAPPPAIPPNTAPIPRPKKVLDEKKITIEKSKRKFKLSLYGIKRNSVKNFPHNLDDKTADNIEIAKRIATCLLFIPIPP